MNIVRHSVSFFFMIPLPYVVSIIATSLIWELVLYFLRKLNFYQNIYKKLCGYCEIIGDKLLNNKLDQPYIGHFIGLGVFIPLLFVGSFIIQQYILTEFSWSLVFLYHLILVGPRIKYYSNYCVLIHREVHTPGGIFKYKFLNRFFEYFLAFFYGHVPEYYNIGHIKNHHKETNNNDDVISVAEFDRTKFSDYFCYLYKFGMAWLGISLVTKFYEQKKLKFVIQLVVGMISYYSIMIILFYLNWRFALGYYVVPLLFNILFLSAINWVWHGFFDKDDPNNIYIISTTILDGGENIYNEDYHVAHHVKHTMHWIDMKEHYEKNKEQFKLNKATMFKETHEIELFFLMIFKQYDMLAKKFVDLSGELSHEDKVNIIKKRLINNS